VALIKRGGGQKYCCRFGELSLLVRTDRERCTPESIWRTVANFDKYETFAREHDQIDFTETAAKISTDRLQAATSQEPKCELFRFVS